MASKRLLIKLYNSNLIMYFNLNHSKKLNKLILIIILYLLVLLIINIINFLYFEVTVVFYSSLLDALISVLIISVAINLFKIYEPFEKFQIIFICLLIGYIYSISVPTIIDRSLSIYILEEIYKNNKAGIKIDDLDELISKKYMREYRVKEMRVSEQLASGTIYIDNDTIFLTEKGRLISIVTTAAREYILPK